LTPFRKFDFSLMRLTASQIETIRNTTQQNFGADASVWLFGSRVDDTRRGGDVDLYVESTQKKTHCYQHCVAKSRSKTASTCMLTRTLYSRDPFGKNRAGITSRKQ
jgi:hypothetical protein